MTGACASQFWRKVSKSFHSTVEPAVPIIWYDLNLLKAAKNRVRSARVMD